MTIYPTSERAAAQADLGDVFRRFFGKQKPAHHGAAVRQNQFGGMVEVHRALDGVAAQMQRADVAFFGNADFGQVGFGGAQAAVGVSWHGIGRMEGKGSILSECRLKCFLCSCFSDDLAVIRLSGLVYIWGNHYA